MRTFSLVLPAFTCLAACNQGAPPLADTTATAATAAAGAVPAREARLPVDGGLIWYRVVGSRTATPAILLHGGPGLSSYYLRSMEALSAHRPVVRYDQLGAGKSDRITDTAMFNIAHFVRELDSLRAHLGYAQVHLIGHSWGTILSIEYYRAHPEHVTSLTLMSPALDMPAWVRNASRLVKTLPDSAQKAIARREADRNYLAPDYQAALDDYYGKYVWRRPAEADLDSLAARINEGIYTYMWGPSEFTITGTLKTYDATPYLRDVKVPVLFTVGEFDESDPPTVKRLAELTPRAQSVVIPGAAHVVQWDAPEETNRVIGAFLQSVDSTKAKR